MRIVNLCWREYHERPGYLGNKGKMIMGLCDQEGIWFVIGGEHRLWLDGEGHLPVGPLSQLPPTWRSLPFERFDEWQGRACFMIDLGEADPGDGFVSLRALMEAGDDEGFRLAGRAWQLLNFRRTHRFCGQCAAPMQPLEREWAVRCASGHVAYPRISPCIIVAVRREGKILLGAHLRHYRHEDPMYTVLAGFAEAGENLEQCVAREVFEESGIRVGNIRYVASQPWPFPHSLMMGFLADYEGGELKVQEDELVAAGFFEPDALPRLPPHGTIARRLIELTLEAIRRGHA